MTLTWLMLACTGGSPPPPAGSTSSMPTSTPGTATDAATADTGASTVGSTSATTGDSSPSDSSPSDSGSDTSPSDTSPSDTGSCTPDDIVSELVFRDGTGADCTSCSAPVLAVLRWQNPCDHDVALPVAHGCWLDSFSIGLPSGIVLGAAFSCGSVDPADVVTVPGQDAVEFELDLSLYLDGPGTYTMDLEPRGMPEVESSFDLL